LRHSVDMLQTAYMLQKDIKICTIMIMEYRVVRFTASQKCNRLQLCEQERSRYAHSSEIGHQANHQPSSVQSLC